MKENRMKLDHMPYDREFETPNGNELCLSPYDVEVRFPIF